jgi:hypothetical protein
VRHSKKKKPPWQMRSSFRDTSLCWNVSGRGSCDDRLRIGFTHKQNPKLKKAGRRLKGKIDALFGERRDGERRVGTRCTLVPIENARSFEKTTQNRGNQRSNELQPKPSSGWLRGWKKGIMFQREPDPT